MFKMITEAMPGFQSVYQAYMRAIEQEHTYPQRIPESNSSNNQAGRP